MNTKFFKKFTIAAIVAVLLAVSIVTAQTHGGGAWVKQETRDKWGDVVGFRYVQTVTASGTEKNKSITRTIRVIYDSRNVTLIEISPSPSMSVTAMMVGWVEVSLRDASGVVQGPFRYVRLESSSYTQLNLYPHRYDYGFIETSIKDAEYKILLEMPNEWNLTATIRGGVPPEVSSKREEEQRRILNTSGSFTDPRDNQTYGTVKIGKLTWMTKNLDYQTPDSRCPNSNCAKYGRLYTWDAAMKACPSGWRLPTLKDWSDLGNNSTIYKSKTGWNTGDGCIPGTDDYGFSALPNDGVGNLGYWWSSSEANGGIIIKYMSYCATSMPLQIRGKDVTLSVRCVQD